MAPNTGVSNSESLSVGRWLFDFYTPSSGPISGDRIIISNGASNGLATILQKFTDPRSTRGIWMIELRWPKDPEQSVGDMAPPPPRLVDVDREMHGDSHFGNTVSNGSFSKIVAPGLRVDWLEATPAFIQDMGTVQVGATVSGGCQSHFASLAVHQLLLTGELEKHMEKVLIPTYRKRHYAMANAIEEKLCPLGVSLIGEDQVRENGMASGFFLYLSFNGCAPGIGAEVVKLAQDEFSLKIPAGTMYVVPDDSSSVIHEKASYFNDTCLCWAWHELDDIVESIDRLAEAISWVKKKHAKSLPESSIEN